MFNWDWIYEEFIKQKITDSEEFSYEQFADMFVEPKRETIDMYYSKTLDYLINNANLNYHCRKLKHEFTQRNNLRSRFGESYQQYWNDRLNRVHESNMSKRARELEDNVQQHVIKRVLSSFGNTHETHGSIPDNNTEISNSGASVEKMAIHTEAEAESGDNNIFWPEIKSILEDTSGVPSCFLSRLNILDFTNKHIIRVVKSRLTIEEFNGIKEKISINDWTPNEAEAKLLLAIKNCNASYRSLRAVIRASAISPETFDAYVHHNILTIEAIITNFLDTLEFHGSFVMNENYERTCASSVVVPIVRQLFKRNPELSAKWFEIQSQFTNKHHFDAVIFYKGLKEPIALAEFGSPLCNEQKIEDDIVKVYRNAHRVLNEIAAKTKRDNTPTVFVLLFHQGILRFETLRLANNLTYVRTCHAKLITPTTPESLKAIAEEMSKIFAWRDSIIANITHLHRNNSDSSSPDCVYDTLSVHSTP